MKQANTQQPRVQYMHYRTHNDDGTVCATGGLTVAFTMAATLRGVEVRYALAQCSDKDNFCRKMGRQVAAGRLNQSARTTRLTVPVGQNVREALHDEMLGLDLVVDY